MWFRFFSVLQHSTEAHMENPLSVLPVFLLHIQFSSAQFSRSVVSDSLWPHGVQHTRFPCPSPNPRAYSNSCPSSWWCHPTVSFSVVPFSFLQSSRVSGSFPMTQFFALGGQSTGASASASAHPMNIQDWFPLELTGCISFKSLLQHRS